MSGLGNPNRSPRPNGTVPVVPGGFRREASRVGRALGGGLRPPRRQRAL